MDISSATPIRDSGLLRPASDNRLPVESVKVSPKEDPGRTEASAASKVTFSESIESPVKDQSREGQEKQQVLSDNLFEALDEINDNLQKRLQHGIQFVVHEDSGDLVVRIIEKDSGEVLRQIPPEEIVQVSSKMEELRGMLLDDQG